MPKHSPFLQRACFEREIVRGEALKQDQHILLWAFQEGTLSSLKKKSLFILIFHIIESKVIYFAISL